MPKIILARHGQTNFNSEGLVQGQSKNSVLTKKGERESANLIATLLKISPMPERIISSFLVRSVQTAKIVADGYQMKFTRDCRLNEIAMGALEESPYSAPGFVDYDSSIRSGNLAVAEKYGAEPLAAVLERMRRFFASLAGKKGDTIAIGHGAANGVYLSSLKGLGVAEYAARQDEFLQRNCTINVIEWNGNDFELKAVLTEDYKGEKRWN